jgi:hypothetical protein
VSGAVFFQKLIANFKTDSAGEKAIACKYISCQDLRVGRPTECRAGQKNHGSTRQHTGLLSVQLVMRRRVRVRLSRRSVAGGLEPVRRLDVKSSAGND